MYTKFFLLVFNNFDCTSNACIKNKTFCIPPNFVQIVNNKNTFAPQQNKHSKELLIRTNIYRNAENEIGFLVLLLVKFHENTHYGKT